MNKTALTEVMMRGSLSLVESASVEEKPKRKGVLGTIKGACADYKHKTRNGNFYSRKLWENAFNDPIIKESMEDRILIGELDHPLSGRLETQATNACIVMTDYSFDDKNGLLEGTFDILDTPNGRILKTLLDAGCKIGVSSRGEGDITEGLSESGEDASCVDPSSYVFVGFDAVVLPAVKKAKPALQESFKRGSFKESIERQINSVKTKNELDVLKNVVEAAELPELDSILESIDNKSKEFDGLTESNNLMDDLETANGRIKDLQEENKALKESLTTCKARVSALLKSRNEIKESCSKQEAQNSALRESAKRSTDRFSKMREKVNSVSEDLSASEETVKRLRNESTQLRDTASTLKKEVDTLEKSLKESQDFARAQISKSKSYSNEVNSLNEKLNQVKVACDEKVIKEKEICKQKINESNKQISKLQESLKTKEAEKQQIIVEYAKVKAQSYGLEVETILNSLTETSTINDVNTLVESVRDRIDRYHSLPISGFGIPNGVSMKVNTGSVRQKVLDEELEHTKSFMEQAIKQM